LEHYCNYQGTKENQAQDTDQAACCATLLVQPAAGLIGYGGSFHSNRLGSTNGNTAIGPNPNAHPASLLKGTSGKSKEVPGLTSSG
jgi:predicted esterase YcpF (UPF0227 family)